MKRMKKSKRVGRAGVGMDEAKYDFDACLELHKKKTQGGCLNGRRKRLNNRASN